MTGVEWLLVVGAAAMVLIVVFALVGGFASWAVASRMVDRILNEAKPAVAEQPRNAFDNAVGEALELVDLAPLNDMPEQTGDDEDNKTVADFLAWADEIAGDGRIAKHLRRMDRWSK